jgi:hypothetical protein
MTTAMINVQRLLAAMVLIAGVVQPAGAQQPLNDVLSFLLTNRSIPTGDFAGDAQAAAAARDAIAGLLLSELTSLPINSPASGFTYRLDPALGTDVRSSSNFGPFFVERSLTAGKGQASLGFGSTLAVFHSIDERSLRDGTLLATASRLVGDTEAFDIETLTLRMEARTLTVSGLIGVTDRLDLSATVPMVNVRFSGERVDTYRGTSVVQANAVASAFGLGDVLVRGKYNAWRSGASGIALAGEARLPTGDADNLLGAGQTTVTPRIIGSAERDRIAAHGNVGYSMGGRSNTVEFAGALTVAGTPRFTLIAEVLGRRVDAGGRLAYVTALHPDLAGVETIRLTGTEAATTRLAMVAGLRWNLAQRWLLNVNVVRNLTSAGLNAPWVPSVTFDYSPGD